MPCIYIIIPVHNRKAYTLECLRCIEKQTFKNCKVVVIDDGSDDGTSAEISKQFPSVHLIHGEGDWWWTGSVNQGLEYILPQCSEDDYVLILNDDLVFSDSYLGTLLAAASENAGSIVGSLVSLQGDENTIAKGGVRINWWTAKKININNGRKRSDFPEGHCEEVSSLTGRGVLFPVEVFKRIGIYDKKHFVHCGDMELPCRAACNGYRLIVAYDAVVYDYPDEKKGINHRNGFRWSDWRDYFFSIRSHTNLKLRFWFGWCCRKNFVQGVSFIVWDFIRIAKCFIKQAATKTP